MDDGSGRVIGLVVIDTSTINDNSHPSGSAFEIEGVKVPKAQFYQTLISGDRVKARYDRGPSDQIEIQLED